MPDNTTMNPGSGGDVIATDEIAGIKYQRIKLIHGGDGVNTGDVSMANPLPTRMPGATGSLALAVESNVGVQVVTGSGVLLGMTGNNVNPTATVFYVYDVNSDSVSAGDPGFIFVIAVEGTADIASKQVLLPWPIPFSNGLRIYAADKNGQDPVAAVHALLFHA